MEMLEHCYMFMEMADGIDERNLPVIHRFGYCDNCRIKWDLDLQITPPAPPQMRCPRCGGTNIQFNLENVVTNYGSRTEIREKRK